MPRQKKIQQDSLLTELDSYSKDPNTVKSIADYKPLNKIILEPISSIPPIKEVITVTIDDSDEDESPIKHDIDKLQKQIDEIFLVMDSIDPLDIDDPEERLKVLKLKMDIGMKMIPLMDQLNTLRLKHKQDTGEIGDIRGNKIISPLEEGLLD